MDWLNGQKVTAIEQRLKDVQCGDCGGGGLTYDPETDTRSTCGTCSGSGVSESRPVWQLHGSGLFLVVGTEDDGGPRVRLRELAGGRGKPVSELELSVPEADVFTSRDLALQECATRNEV